MNKKNISHTYHIKFIAEYEDGNEVVSNEVNFQAQNPDEIKTIISALSSFYSGDDCKCWIDGQEAVLYLDWGLLE